MGFTPSFAESVADAQLPEVRAWSAGLETLSLDERLAWCWQEFGKSAAVGTSLQGAGLVILHRSRELGLDFPVFTVDTGLLFSETLTLKAQVEQRLGIQIESLHPEQTLAEQAAEYGAELWKRSPDLCCTLRKVLPLQKKLAELDVWITGLRREQGPTRSKVGILERYEFDRLREQYLLKFNPLAGWPRERVRAYLKAHNLPMNPLKSQGYTSIGCQPCTHKLPPDAANERAGRWTGFDKTECGIHTFLGENI
ncbi:MAG: phosphoadenylyl-sulfate reductase [Verrucomicrobia bacterium]|nr:phosphoadenylyl-sulfate reductase [Verrucomicrobiota bacterium]